MNPPTTHAYLFIQFLHDKRGIPIVGNKRLGWQWQRGCGNGSGLLWGQENVGECNCGGDNKAVDTWHPKVFYFDYPNNSCRFICTMSPYKRGCSHLAEEKSLENFLPFLRDTSICELSFFCNHRSFPNAIGVVGACGLGWGRTNKTGFAVVIERISECKI